MVVCHRELELHPCLSKSLSFFSLFFLSCISLFLASHSIFVLVSLCFPLNFLPLPLFLFQPLTAEEVKRLKARVDALEQASSSSSAHSSRLSSSSAINIIDPLESAYIDKTSSPSSTTLLRSDNGINLGVAAGAGPGSANGPGQDPVALQRAVQQIVRTELQSDTVRGTEPEPELTLCTSLVFCGYMLSFSTIKTKQ